MFKRSVDGYGVAEKHSSYTTSVSESHDPWISIARKWHPDAAAALTLHGTKFDLTFGDRPQQSLWVYLPCELPKIEHSKVFALHHGLIDVVARQTVMLEGKHLPVLRQASVAYMQTLHSTFENDGTNVILFVPDIELQDLPAWSEKAWSRHDGEI